MDIINFNDFSAQYQPNLNTSSNRMSKYEFAKIIGLREEELDRGAPPTIPTENLKSTKEICLKELKEKTIPFIISRSLPNGKKEYWRIADMVIPYLIDPF